MHLIGSPVPIEETIDASDEAISNTFNAIEGLVYSFKDFGGPSTSKPKAKKKIQIVCDQCLATFKTTREMKTHKLTEHGSDRFKCDQCTQSFSKENNLIRHKHSHSGKELKCHYCNYKTYRIDNLNTHIKRCKKRPVD